MRETIMVAIFMVGNLIGAGFFMMPAAVAPLGFNLLWSWSVGALIALTFSLIFGKLFVLFPNSETLSDFFSDFAVKKSVAVAYWIGAIVGNVLLLTMILSSLKINDFYMASFYALMVMFVLTWINHFLSYESVEMIEIFLSFSKFFLLIFIPLYIFLSNPAKLNIPVSKGSFSDIAKFGALSFWAFLGIETAGVFGKGESAKNGLLLGILACFFLYVFSCFLIVGVVPFELLTSGQEIPLVYLIQHSHLASFARFVPFLISFTCFGALYGWVAATSKMSLSYAKNGIFHDVFLKETESGNSQVGLWGSSFVTLLIFVLVGGLDLTLQFELIADFCVNITLLIFSLCAYALFKKSNLLFDRLLSLFGGFFLFFLLAMNFKASLISLILFVFVFGVAKINR